MRTFWMSGLLLAGALWGMQARAAEAPQLDMQMQKGQVGGHLSDGARLGLGRITDHNGHVGFQVWLEGSQAGQQPNRYVLTGAQGDSHRLRVRLEQDGWQVDNKDGKGIVLHSGDDTAMFALVVDGDQKVVPDRYPVDVKGVSLLP